MNALETYRNPRVDGKAAAERVALAAQGAREYHGYQNTRINHIFLTNARAMYTSDRYIITANVCTTKVPVDTYECEFHAAWDCTYKGSLYSHHDLVTGHLWATAGQLPA